MSTKQVAISTKGKIAYTSDTNNKKNIFTTNIFQENPPV